MLPIMDTNFQRSQWKESRIKNQGGVLEGNRTKHVQSPWGSMWEMMVGLSSGAAVADTHGDTGHKTTT